MGVRSFRDPVTGVLVAWGYTDGNRPGDVMQDEPDGFALTPGQWRWDGAQWTADPATVLDARGFEVALHEAFGTDLVAFNTLLGAFPLFLWALRDGTWPAVGQMIVGARAAGAITQAQYDAIKVAATQHAIPVSL
jgi:hypothetical protein